MNELKKSIPFFVSLLIVFVLFVLNPNEDRQLAQIKEDYVEHKTAGNLTWPVYKRSIEHYDYLFVSVVKHKHNVVGVGFLGMIFTWT